MQRKEKKKKRGETKKNRKKSKEKKKKENKKKRKGKKKKEKEKKRHKSAPHKKDRSSLFRSGNRNSVIGFNQDEVISTPENYSYEDETYEECSGEEYSSKEKHEEPDVPGLWGKGLKVEEGQKLTQKQLQMLETVAEEKLEDSTNPLCKDPNQLFRSLTSEGLNHE